MSGRGVERRSQSSKTASGRLPCLLPSVENITVKKVFSGPEDVELALRSLCSEAAEFLQDRTDGYPRVPLPMGRVYGPVFLLK